MVTPSDPSRYNFYFLSPHFRLGGFRAGVGKPGPMGQISVFIVRSAEDRFYIFKRLYIYKKEY